MRARTGWLRRAFAPSLATKGQDVGAPQDDWGLEGREPETGATTQPGPARAGLSRWSRAGLGWARRAAGAALDVVYPPVCLACRGATAQTQALCPACWTQVAFVERPYCERLGLPLQADPGVALLSPQAVADPPVCARIRCVALFDDGPVRQLVHRLKYDDAPELAPPMGRWMARAGRELLADADVIVPTPMHRRRLFARRFNQAAALAQAVAREAGRPLDVATLARVKATRPQVGLTRAERAANMQGAFRAAPGGFAGRRVLLIDDVATSGATLNAAARAALRAGATAVDGLVFARVVGDRALPI